MSDDVEVKTLKSLSVAQDATSFRIGLTGAQDRDYGLVFLSEALNVLMMSLFRLVEVTLYLTDWSQLENARTIRLRAWLDLRTTKN